jgi:phage tail sheath protein FI
LEYAVRGFFENGGEYCVVAPVHVSECDYDARTLTRTLRKVFTDSASRIRDVFDDLEDVDLMCVPDLMVDSIRADADAVVEIQQSVLQYCHDRGDWFAILDACPTDDLEAVIQQWQNLSPTDGALYFPWLQVEPLSGSAAQFVPPCGHVAGIYARTDTQIGVHKAPANALIAGALDVSRHLTDEESGRLNEAGVNGLREIPGHGIRVWGARTLSGLPSWQYVNVRRLFLSLVRWIDQNMRDLTFETHTPSLWNRVQERLGAHCYTLFQKGALKGMSPDEAFFVKCSAETNPPAVREAGQLICEVGLAPVRPAEFLVVRVTHSAIGATTTFTNEV